MTTEPPFCLQMLDQQFEGTVTDVVEAVGGMNAQTRFGPSVSLWTRMRAFEQRDLEGLLIAKDLVRCNLMRGTVHLVTRGQYLRWRACLQPLLERLVKQHTLELHRFLDLEDLKQEGIRLLRHTGVPLTRAEIGRELAKKFPSFGRIGDLGFAVRMLVPVIEATDEGFWRGQRTRYLLAEDTLGEQLGPLEEGAADLRKTFHGAFGGTARDFSYWSGIGETSHHATTSYADCRYGRDSAPRSCFVLAEFDNLFFCRRQSNAAFYLAKKRKDFPAGRMPGSLVHEREVIATWQVDNGHAVLNPWIPALADCCEAEWNRFSRWRLSLDAY